MTYKRTYVRPGLTAIAAVLALSSTPALAQQIDPLAPTAEPVADAPLAADPLAPDPVVDEPIVTEEAPAETVAPAPVRRSAARTPAARPGPRPVAAAPRDAAPAEENPVAAEPAPALAESLPSPVPIAAPAEPPADLQPQSGVALADDALPIAGGAALGLLLLGGIGMAARRRRRRDEHSDFAVKQAYLDSHPEPLTPAEPEPAFVRPVSQAAPSAAAAASAPRTRLPEGFDLSRFGPHVRAAYQGPTPDNPSLSLKYRLRKAAAMDQRARLEAERRQPTPVSEPMVSQPARHPVAEEGFMFRRPKGPSIAPALKPAWQN